MSSGRLLPYPSLRLQQVRPVWRRHMPVRIRRESMQLSFRLRVALCGLDVHQIGLRSPAVPGERVACSCGDQVTSRPERLEVGTSQ